MPRQRNKALIVAVGSRMRAMRHWRQMTLEQVAAAVAVAWQQVQKYETGLSDPPCSTLVRIASALDTTPNDLLLPLQLDTPQPAAEIEALLSDPSVAAIVKRLRAMDTPQRKFAHALICTMERAP